MSEYNDVVAAKLRLKGKAALDVKSNGVPKKKKHYKRVKNLSTELAKEDLSASVDNEEHTGRQDDRLTAAEKRYLERWRQLEMQRLAKGASKSHRERIQEFNQYLANLTEHYDIPKVGPG